MWFPARLEQYFLLATVRAFDNRTAKWNCHVLCLFGTLSAYKAQQIVHALGAVFISFAVIIK